MMEIMIRKGKGDDAADLADVETACFPPAEAATAEEIDARLSVYPSHFFLLYSDGILTGFIDGMVTNEKDLRDEMYADASLHDEAGDWQMIFGLNTLPSYRRLGLAGRLIEAMKEDAKNRAGKESFSPAKKSSFTITQSSALKMKENQTPPTGMSPGTRCASHFENDRIDRVDNDSI